MILNSEQDAIKQAVEAGYQSPFWESNPIEAFWHWLGSDAGHLTFTLQDPAFWQALGKARGWNAWQCTTCSSDIDACAQPDLHRSQPNDWMTHALRYFETRLSNGDLTKFWQNLP